MLKHGMGGPDRDRRPETTLALSLAYALAVTMAAALLRHILGDQASNCVLLALLWAVFYKNMRQGRRPAKRRNRQWKKQ